jgi:ACR3 family arsenite efflux pump ArsB
LCWATSRRACSQRAGGLEYASVNLVVAVLIWAMVYPMMIAIDFGSAEDRGGGPRGWSSRW